MTISPVTSSSADTAAQAITTAAQSGSEIDFAALLQEGLKSDTQDKILSMTASSLDTANGMDATASLSGGTGLESLILAAAATGEVDDAQTAIFMLLMMMQSESGGSGDMSILMGLMSSMIGQLELSGQKKLYNTVMSSDFDRGDLLTVEAEIFSGIPATQEVTRTGADAVVPTQSWKAATPSVTGDENSRTPEALREIIDQFDVESSERYRPFRNGVTYCNIFVWDVTSALGCEIPHYIDNDTGEPRTYPDVSNAWEMNANATHDWLVNRGESYGWREVSAQQAQAWANEGRPAVTAWKNEGGKPGHVQIVCPSEDGGYDSVRGVAVAQAGARVTGYSYISSTFKQADLKDVRYFIHD